MSVPNERRIKSLHLLQISDPLEISLQKVECLAQLDPEHRQDYFDAYIYLRDEPYVLEVPTPAEIQIGESMKLLRHEAQVKAALAFYPRKAFLEERGPLA